MALLDNIKNRTNIDVDMLIKRLENELKITKNNSEDTDEPSQIEYALYDTLVIILGIIHQPKVPEELYTTWYRMTKDYWYLNGYDKLSKSNADGENNNDDVKIKSIQVGDTNTTFVDQSSQVKINGVTYSTGTINYSEDALVEKYKSDLYRYRKMRW